MRALRPFLPFVLVAGLATGCAADVVTGGADAPTETPTQTPTEAAAMADGEHFGFLTAVATNPATVTIDPATWVADDAEPNGYRIDDPGLDPVDLPLAADAEIEVLTSTGDPTTATVVDVAELRAWFEGLAAPDETAPFDLVVADGEVVEMSFVYRP